MTQSKKPVVSVGIPVHNGERTIKNSIESILAQSLRDIEIIISDNCSCDSTPEICQKYASSDSRIKYFRQSKNIGATLNFKFVLEKAEGIYFTWLAADDTRSQDFLELNVKALDENKAYVASTSPNRFEGVSNSDCRLVSFSLTGSLRERLSTFMENCWRSHGIFYSVMRTDVIINCDLLGKSYPALDWAVDVYLAVNGEINRTEGGEIILGRSGISSSSGAWAAFRTSKLELLIPFFHFSKYMLSAINNLSRRDRLPLLFSLLRINLLATRLQAHGELYRYYATHIKPYIKAQR